MRFDSQKNKQKVVRELLDWVTGRKSKSVSGSSKLIGNTVASGTSFSFDTTQVGSGLSFHPSGLRPGSQSGFSQNESREAAPVTFEGALAVDGLKPIEVLRRSVLSCLLWEDEFYESGDSIADRIRKYAGLVSTEELAALAFVII